MLSTAARAEEPLRHRRRTDRWSTADVASGGSAGQADRRRRGEFAVAYDDDYLLVVDKPAGVVVHPARGHWSGTLAQALAGARRRRRGPVPRRDRAPPRSRHLGVDRGRQERRGPPGAEGAAGKAGVAPRVPGSGRRGARGANRARSTRRSGAIVATGAAFDRHRRAARGADPLRVRASRSAAEALLRVSLGDRAHPPDPGPHGGDRHPVLGDPLTADRRASGSAAVPARRAARVPAPGDRRDVDLCSPLPGRSGAPRSSSPGSASA